MFTDVGLVLIAWAKCLMLKSTTTRRKRLINVSSGDSVHGNLYVGLKQELTWWILDVIDVRVDIEREGGY